MKRRTDDATAANGPLDLDWPALDRYFSGEASAADLAMFERITSSAEGAALLRSMREIWDAAGIVAAPSAPNVDAAWRTMEGYMGENAVALPTPRARSGPAPTAAKSGLLARSMRRQRTWPAMLATVAAVLVGALIIGRIEPRAPEKNAAPTYGEYVTRRAQRADIYLSDGTRVVLNVDSRLRVPTTFGATAREVTLDGEAYFEVVHDSTRPFRVHTRSGVAEDAGTVFVVARYPEADGMRVAVKSGVVVLKRPSTNAPVTTLRGGDVAQQKDAGHVTVRHHVDVDNDAAWTQGKLVFDRVPLRDVIPRLARWLDADIRLGDAALGNVRYTASIRNEPVSQVLDLLAASLDAHVTRGKGSIYVLHAGKRAP